MWYFGLSLLVDARDSLLVPSLVVVTREMSATGLFSTPLTSPSSMSDSSGAKLETSECISVMLLVSFFQSMSPTLETSLPTISAILPLLKKPLNLESSPPVSLMLLTDLLSNGRCLLDAESALVGERNPFPRCDDRSFISML